MDLRVDSLRARYGAFRLDASLVAPGNSWTSILGPSGSGKTSLLRLVAGFAQPDSGRILLGAEDLTRVPCEKRRVGFVFQDQALFPHLDVGDNVGFGLSVAGLARRECRRRADEVLALCHLAGFGGRRVEGLSGGERQRVAIARALATEPRILLLDEPLTAIDAALKKELRALLRAIQREKRLLVVSVTHDQDEALAISDAIVLLRDGGVVQGGSPQELWDCPANAFAARFLGDANLIPAASKLFAMIAPRFESIAVPVDPLRAAKLRLFIRAERIALDEPRGDAFTARVIGAEYRGGRWLYGLQAEDVRLAAESPRYYRAGDRVRFSFAEADARMIEES